MKTIRELIRCAGGKKNIMLGFNEGLTALIAAYIIMCIAIAVIVAIIGG